ncbi:E3 ubiquitin/ISG15 ligase TRIM25-like [Pelobates fuscus]|uniref:E3 ubiquitin/ISG15 ligase TRIM25-like n=1 Tax=Pelobates fuscus TaxID=191477 RepID=UPI002FE4BA6A
MASADLREELNCSVCLNIYMDPVMLSCGHNFCRACIGNVLDSQEGAGVYTCPDCRAEFQERPVLQSNLKLRNIADNFVSKQPEKEDSGIFCTYCVHTPVPAAKTCLHCEASLCDVHLSVHSKSATHVLTDPISSLENRKCSVHKEPLKYYCSQDATCVCVTCMILGDHRGHQVCTLNEASGKEKEKMRNVLEKLNLKLEETKIKLQNLQERKSEVQDKAAGVTERVSAFFRDIRKQLKSIEKRIQSEISQQEEQISLRVSDVIQRLEIKKEDLTRKVGHIEELCDMTDPLTVLQGWQADSADFNDHEDDGETDGDNDTSSAVGDLDEVLVSLNLQRELNDVIDDAMIKNGLHVPEFSDLLLDVNTAANDVSVSEDLKTISRSDVKLNRPQRSERFLNYQAFSKRTFLSGRHYWELETSDTALIAIGVSYPSTEKEGRNSLIGNNNKSWCLYMSDTGYAVLHDSKPYPLLPAPSCHRFGIYLDYEAGRLSFYELCDPVRHLYTFTAAFTEPLHAGFVVNDKGWIRIRPLYLYTENHRSLLSESHKSFSINSSIIYWGI